MLKTFVCLHHLLLTARMVAAEDTVMAAEVTALKDKPVTVAMSIVKGHFRTSLLALNHSTQKSDRQR